MTLTITNYKNKLTIKNFVHLTADPESLGQYIKRWTYLFLFPIRYKKPLGPRFYIFCVTRRFIDSFTE